MIDALLFICTLIIFLDYMHKSYVTKDPDDPETQKWIDEIDADKRRDKYKDQDK